MSAISKYLFARKDLLETTICLSNIATLKNGYAFQSGKYNALGKWKILTITNVPGERYINDEDCNCIINLPNDIQDHQVLKPYSSNGNNILFAAKILHSYDECIINELRRLTLLTMQKQYLLTQMFI